MTKEQVPRWLEWAREIQALAQTGYHYAENEYQRYERLTEIATEIICNHTRLEFTPLLNAFQAQIGYVTSRVDERGVVFRDGKLLQMRERAYRGWMMPGGWADAGDTISWISST